MGDRPSLPEALSVVLGSAPTPSATRTVVDHCHRVACAYLRHQQQAGALREDLLGADVEGLAMDAIAELFERDDAGQFPELRRYFADRTAPDGPAAETRDALRRLVLGAVTDRLFEAYRAADRSLSTLIRALKRAAKTRDDVRLQRRGNTLWVAPDDAPAAGGRRMPMEVLEAHLTGLVEEDPSTAAFLAEAVRVLRTHPDYAPAYPVTRLAQVVRSARVRVQSVTDHDPPVTTPDWPPLTAEEVTAVIAECVDAVRRDKRDTYVGTGTVSSDTYAAYFRALRDRVEARFVPDTPDLTHYDALAAHLPALSKAEYRDAHRGRFEYLEQCVRAAFEDRLEHVAT